MNERRLLCFVRGRPGAWEGICLDFDIAVQGRSFDEVRELLVGAIDTYIRDVAAETPETRRRLLGRRAPWHVRTGYVLQFVWHTLVRRKGDDGLQAGFELPCPA